MYFKGGGLRNAAKLFDDMSVKDTVSWNTMMDGYLRHGELEIGFSYFKPMLELGTRCFDRATLTTIISAFDGNNFLYVTKMMHALAILSGYERSVPVGNALITSYVSGGCFSSGRLMFDEMIERNVVTWTAMISGLVRNRFYKESLELFLEMRKGLVSPNELTFLSLLVGCSGLQALKEGCQFHGLVWKLGMQSDLRIESTLMDMYSKCGSVDDTWKIFESAQVLDEVSMTVILAGFAQNGQEEEAVSIFVRMVKAGVEIVPDMIASILGVFGVDTSLALGKQIHSLVIKKNFGSNTFVNNGLVNMYSKCGELEESIKFFDGMPKKNSVSWNSMIAAFARHGNVARALELYEEMRLEGQEPTDVTFLSLLHACGHVGLLDKGMEIMDLMERDFAIHPRVEHHACVVDMLGRAGLLNEAKSYIERLAVKPDLLLWQALLGACSIHGNSEVGKYAAYQLSLAAPDSPVPHILMANIYSSKGKWEERAESIKRMKGTGVAKETGASWIEIERQVHSFVVSDHMHPQREVINGTLLQLLRHLRDEGYMPDNRFILHYLGQDEHKL